MIWGIAIYPQINSIKFENLLNKLPQHPLLTISTPNYKINFTITAKNNQHTHLFSKKGKITPKVTRQQDLLEAYKASPQH
jgi:hypothetical protein